MTNQPNRLRKTGRAMWDRSRVNRSLEAEFVHHFNIRTKLPMHVFTAGVAAVGADVTRG